jgi:hypothetical protein
VWRGEIWLSLNRPVNPERLTPEIETHKMIGNKGNSFQETPPCGPPRLALREIEGWGDGNGEQLNI